MKNGRIKALSLAVAALFMFAGLTEAATIVGNNLFSSPAGSFGMMNGMAGSPVVGDDGTAYLVTYDTIFSPGAIPSSNVFQSRVLAIDLAGTVRTLILDGIVSRPVIAGGFLFASASMSNMTDFVLAGDFRNYQGNGQAVVYGMPLDFTSSTKPIALAIDGNFVSVPVIANSRLYVMASDFGNAMMTGSNTFRIMFGDYNFNSNGNAKSYLYIFNLDGSLVSKTLIP